MADDIVKFLLPDGTEVSNDPRFQFEEVRAKMLASVPNRGVEGPSPEEQALAQVPDAEAQDALQQEFASGRAWQRDDRAAADDRGADPLHPQPEPTPAPDVNEQIREMREQQEDEREEAEAARDEPQGDLNVPYVEWSGAEIKAELKRRGITDLPDRKKSTAVAALERDDSTRTA